MTRTIFISYNSRQVSLESFCTGVSVVLKTVRISFVADLETPLTTWYSYVCIRESQTGLLILRGIHTG